ncbi:TlyA family RNA methyltransferase [Nostocoides australiense]|nr:TlyA family RNA methyltransferase [Austwickia sp.]HPF81646.1 TlyA family RNA methyltransferase [Tetrasphaera australiensis]
MSGGERLDQALVARGLARSRGQARELLEAGRVRLNEAPAAKPATRVGPGDRLAIDGDLNIRVGRGADKLDAAVTAFEPAGLAVAGKRALDVGASTGGFTQILLERGASEVLALDVGHDQLAEPVRSDPRVHDLSGRSIRGLTPDDIGGSVDLLVADLSFISLTLVMADLERVSGEAADLILLIKPQFEVGRGRLDKKGIVRDPTDRAGAMRDVLQAGVDAGLCVRGLIASPVVGTHGNREYLGWLAKGGNVSASWQALEEQIDDLVRRDP